MSDTASIFNITLPKKQALGYDCVVTETKESELN